MVLPSHYMNWQNVINTEELKEINRKYLDEIKSLEKTAIWVGKNYGVQVSRSQLTLAFRSKGLEVRKANGRTDEEYVPINKYRSAPSEFASEMISLALRDLYKYKNDKNGTLIDYLSACHLLTTEFYTLLVDTLKAASPWHEGDTEDGVVIPKGIMIGGKIVPLNVTLQDIQAGNELYTNQYRYHFGVLCEV